MKAHGYRLVQYVCVGRLCAPPTGRGSAGLPCSETHTNTHTAHTPRRPMAEALGPLVSWGGGGAASASSWKSGAPLAPSRLAIDPDLLRDGRSQNRARRPVASALAPRRCVRFTHQRGQARADRGFRTPLRRRNKTIGCRFFRGKLRMHCSRTPYRDTFQ
jgi:hypothetical protein